MKNHNKLFRTAIGSALTGAVLLTSVPAQACDGDGTATMASICTTAANFCPRGTLPADGRILPIASYQALYSLMGTTYGGDGRSTFGLPDLRGRSPIGTGQGPGLSQVVWGQRRGNEATTLAANNMPQHIHGLAGAQADGAVVAAQVPASSAGGNSTAAGPNNVLASAGRNATYTPYSSDAADTSIKGADVAVPALALSGNTQPAGASVRFSNVPPQLGMTYCVVSEGIYPARP